MAGMKIRVAVASGLGNAQTLLDRVKNGEADYQFIEIMGCPGGCVDGGGQPIQSPDVRRKVDVKAARAKALYNLDASMTYRKSHDNPAIKKLYDEYLGMPGSEKAHHILHTSYVKREVYDI